MVIIFFNEFGTAPWLLTFEQSFLSFQRQKSGNLLQIFLSWIRIRIKNSEFRISKKMNADPQPWSRVLGIWEGSRILGIREGPRILGIREGPRILGIWEGSRIFEIREGPRILGILEGPRPSRIWEEPIKKISTHKIES